jgi:hypothetical protein
MTGIHRDRTQIPPHRTPALCGSSLKPARLVPMNKARLNSNGGGNLPDCV